MSTVRPWSPPASAMLVDVTRCTGCERCVQACVEINQLDAERADRDGATAAGGLSSQRLCTLATLEEGRSARVSCMHCLEPSCVSACLVGGLTKTAEGAVVYHPEKCIGCRYCMLACPFHVPRYEWESPHPFVRKCNLCHPRLVDDKLPACVEACPHEALSFGSRDEMLKLARRRIDESPGRYIAHVWGEHEWGGTSVLYLSDVDMAAIGLDRVHTTSVPSITDPVIHSTPILFVSVAAAMTGLSWIVRRRQLLMGQTDGEQEGGRHE